MLFSSDCSNIWLGPDSDKPSLSVSQLFLEEQRFSQREAQRTLGQRVRLYLLRFVLNVTVVCLLAGAFYLIHFATNVSQTEVRHFDIGRPPGTHSAEVVKWREKLSLWALCFRVTTGWSASFCSICPPSPSLWSTCSYPKSFARSPPLRTTPSRRRSMPPS